MAGQRVVRSRYQRALLASAGSWCSVPAHLGLRVPRCWLDCELPASPGVSVGLVMAYHDQSGSGVNTGCSFVTSKGKCVREMWLKAISLTEWRCVFSRAARRV